MPKLKSKQPTKKKISSKVKEEVSSETDGEEVVPRKKSRTIKNEPSSSNQQVKKAVDIPSESGKEVKFAIPEEDFSSLISEILHEMKKEDIKFEKEAEKALQTATENFMENVFTAAGIAAGARRRNYVNDDDIKLVRDHFLEMEKEEI